jgi:hypothetical protein
MNCRRIVESVIGERISTLMSVFADLNAHDPRLTVKRSSSCPGHRPARLYTHCHFMLLFCAYCHFMVQTRLPAHRNRRRSERDYKCGSATLWFNPVPSYGSKHKICDLKHNFAVWQRYALNDLEIPIDCDLNACCGHPQNLAPLSNNRKVAVPKCDGASHQVVLAAKLCFQPRKRRGRALSR